MVYAIPPPSLLAESERLVPATAVLVAVLYGVTNGEGAT